MKRVLIFGALGFVGRYLAAEFAEHGYSVFTSDALPAASSNPEFPYYQTDITLGEEVRSAIESAQPDYIVNLAAISSVALSWKDPQKTFAVNVLGILNVLQSLVELKRFKTKTLVVGSSEEYLPKTTPLSIDDPLDSNNPYGISKTTQEQLAGLFAEKYGLSIIRTRSFNHTGVGQNDAFVIPSFCKQVAAIEKSGKPGRILVGNLSVYRDFSDVRDVVGCYRWLLENKNEGIFNVGSGEAHSLKEILDSVIAMATQPIEVVVDPAKIRPADTPYICCKKEDVPYPFTHPLKETLKDLYLHYLHQ
jgi:GDP-4-dehydro-6-deoxy-D-mannose reductase